MHLSFGNKRFFYQKERDFFSSSLIAAFDKKFQISFPDTGKDHVPFSTSKDFLTPTYFEIFFFTPCHFSFPWHTLLGSVVRLYSCTAIQSVSTYTTFCLYWCTHFACPSYTYIKTCGIHTLLGSVVRLYSHIVILSGYTCILSLLVHTLCLAQ